MHNSGTQGDNLIQLVQYWTHGQKWCVASHTKLRFSCSVSFLLTLHLFSSDCYEALYFNHSHVLSVESATWSLTCLKFNNHISLLSLNNIKIRPLCLHARVIPVVHVLAVHYHPSVPASANSQLTYQVVTTLCLRNWKNCDRIWSSVNLSAWCRSSFVRPRHSVVIMTDVTSHYSVNCRWRGRWRLPEG